MTANAATTVLAPVKKSITVKASVEHAFEVFTDGFDSWWPRSHHIGKQPMVKAVIETRAGGRCFGREADGTECDWGRVLAWDPPHRFVLAWQIDPKWQYEPDLTKASEVEVRFTPEAGGSDARRSRTSPLRAPRRGTWRRSSGRRFAGAAGAACCRLTRPGRPSTIPLLRRSR